MHLPILEIQRVYILKTLSWMGEEGFPCTFYPAFVLYSVQFVRLKGFTWFVSMGRGRKRDEHISSSSSSFLPWAICFMLSLVMSAPKNAGEKRGKRKMTSDSQCLEILFWQNVQAKKGMVPSCWVNDINVWMWEGNLVKFHFFPSFCVAHSSGFLLFHMFFHGKKCIRDKIPHIPSLCVVSLA